jgi:hypothetical protein
MQLGDFEALIEKLKAHFPENDKVRTSISVDLPEESLTFKSIDEMREYKALPDRLTQFTFYLSASRQAIRLSHVIRRIKAEGPAEAWCAAVVEEGAAYIGSFRVWYSWLRASVESLSAWILVSSVPWLGFVAISRSAAPLRTKVVVLISLFAVWILVGLLVLKPDRMFPVATLVVRDRGSWLRNHNPELALLIAFLALVVAIVALFVH